jgi:hypothetical protein
MSIRPCEKAGSDGTINHLLTVNLGGGTIDHVVNETGDPVTSAAIGVPSHVVRYPDR